MVPPVHLQDLLVIPREGPGLLGLPEYPSAGPDEVVVEQSLVERPLPPLPVQRFEGLPAPLNPLEPRAGFGLLRAVQVRLQGVARDVPDLGFPGLFRLNAVV